VEIVDDKKDGSEPIDHGRLFICNACIVTKNIEPLVIAQDSAREFLQHN